MCDSSMNIYKNHLVMDLYRSDKMWKLKSFDFSVQFSNIWIRLGTKDGHRKASRTGETHCIRVGPLYFHHVHGLTIVRERTWFP